MKDVILKTSTPLISLFVFMLSNGLFNTLTTIRLHQEGYDSVAIGILGAAFYAGLFLGSFKIESIILKVGHIRAYAAFSAGLTCVYLFHGMNVNLYTWLPLRIMSGFCTAGLFIVIESWLVVMSDSLNRGKILAIYMVILYSGQALGQFLLEIGSPETMLLFSIAASLSAISIIPLSLTKISNPTMEEPSLLNFSKLFKLTASGVVGCFVSGTILSAVYSLVPLYVSQELREEGHVALIMAIIIFGGVFMQYPIGKLSDVIERRKVLLALNIMTIINSFIFMFLFQQHALLYFVFFIFGGMIFTIYPISISYACDSLDSKDITAGIQTLLLSYSAGSVIGPLIAPIFMRTVGSNGLFVYFIFVNVIMLLFIGWRRTQHEAMPQEENFIPVVQTTPVINEIDPRLNDEIALSRSNLNQVNN